MNFEHDYYTPPTEPRKSPTVLCMCCEKAVRSSSLTPEEMKTLYREKNVQWSLLDGRTVNGVVILCPVCVDKKLEESDYPKILNQITKAFVAEAEWSHAKPNQDLVGASIAGEA